MAVKMEGASPPVFEQIFRNARFAQGGNALFEGKVAGSPRPQVVWTRKGLQMQGSDKHQMMYDEASGKVSLLIKAIGPGDEGEYTCTALNPYGEAICTVYISPEATKAVKKSRSSHKISKSKSGHDQQMVLQQQQEQQQLQSQQQQSMQKSMQQSFQQSSSSAVQQSSMQSSSMSQQASSSSFSQSSSSFEQQSSMQQSSSAAFQMSSGFQQQSSSVQQSSIQQSSASWQSSGNQQAQLKEAEPEVIYLKHVERQAQQQSKEETTTRYSAPAFSTPLKDVTVNEGERSHFEAKVGPVGDPSMTVEWYCNGNLISASSRINTACQFGFVSMDMLNTTSTDMGEYTCVVKTDSGSVQSSCRLVVQQRREIESEMHSSSLKMVQEQQVQQVQVQEEAVPPPKFQRPLQNMGERMEGSSIKLEAQVTPSSDSSMKIDWFKDGQPITASSRIGTIFSFGYVSLNISDLRAEDAGTYTCRAINKSGEDRTQASFNVKASNSMTASTGLEEQQAYIQKTEQLEMYQASKMSKAEMTIEQPNQAPEFKTNIKDQAEVKEGGFAHFEARLEPMGDHTMNVQWLKDGQPVEASSRITSFFNFGYVALTVKQVALHDQGTYSCVASNAAGRAETKAQLRCNGRADAEFQSKSWESVQKMESRKVETHMEIQQEVTSAPRFVSALKGTNVVLEGQKAHFECRVEPQNDPKMSVQWYFNGQVLSASSRIQTFHDFGYVAIDINDAKKEDSGTYTLVASNVLGTQKAEVSLNVNAHAQVDYSSMHSRTVEETKRFEMKQEVKQEFEEVAPTGPPVFKLNLVSPDPVSDGKNIHLEARLEPIGDPTMKVEWFFNGRPLTIGSRFKTYNDFGFIALDILGVTSLDAGQYVCRASNKMGEASTQAEVRVLAKSSVITETEHESAMQQISYLESEKVKMVTEEEAAKVAPSFTKALKNVETGEGQNIHLEARLSPTGDSTMKVEWTVNSKPLKTGHRFRPAYDFDYVALDLLSVYPEDSGVYTCHARNAYGEAVSSATIKITGQAQVVSESRTELKQFASLETKSSTRMEVQEETTVQAPVFTSSPKSVDVREGQKAHFEARIIPVSDPTLKIEWFFNGQPIKQGSRFREGHDFGFVSLDISHVLPEDAGQYSCRATNNLGQAVCNASLTCKATGSLVKETIHESALQQINYLESKSNGGTQEEGFTSQAPEFTANIRDQKVVEGAPAHFEAKLVPIGDPKLRVEWLKDGRPIEASNRMSTLHDFGFVALDLKYTRPADAGKYSIRAYNALGDTTVSANLQVVSAQGGADMATMHGEALEKIAYLERHKAKMEMDSEDGCQSKPSFSANLQGKTQLLEGQSAHLECRIDPYPDSTLRVEWFHNGKPLPFGNRWRTSYDFGFAALDILGAYAEDSGKYTIRATNLLGSAESSVNIVISSGKGLLLDSDHQDALDKIKYLESKHQKTAEEEMAAPEKPQFGRPLKNIVLDEGQPAHFETTLTPVNDASMRVEWLFNGKAVPQGHRFRTTYDFGFVALDILYAYPEDSGTYTCVAKNVLGETRSQCTLQVQGKAGLLLDTMDKDRLGQLRNLEQRERTRVEEAELTVTKPVFTTPLNNVEGAMEGAHIHLECRLEPINDPKLRVEWFVNNKAIKIGSRFRTTHDFGYVALDVLQSYAEDSGTYMCRATNKLGEAVNSSSVSIIARKGLLLDSQHPEGWEKMQGMERRQRYQTLEVEEPSISAPKFVTQLQGITSLAEGQSAHFEAQIEPIHDSSLKVEFLHNGRALQQASRIHTVCDFGYVALDIGQLISQDAGEYVCIAKNALGECRSSINLNIAARGSLDTSSQRPDALGEIRELESRGPKSRSDEVQTFQKPMFTTALQNVEGGESSSAHLAARLIPVGDPSLRVEWLKDGKVLETGSRIKTSLDFGLVKLDIDSIRSSDVGIYTCKAVNLNGEATSTTSIKVQDERAAGQEGAKDVGPPNFVTQLQSRIEISEGQSAHFEARLTPTEDPNMKIEWFKDGAPLSVGNRWRTFHDFGIVILDILYCYASDSGTYECRATNKLGKDSTSGSVSCSEKSGLILTPQVPGEMREQTLQQIQQLESHKTLTSQTSTSSSTTAPRFTTPISNIAGLKEGENAHFECRLLPTDDPNMTIEWFWNGKALKAGSRIRTFCDFGFVILEISPVYPEDAGEYTCRAKNALGEAVTSATLTCSGKRNIILDSQLPTGMEGAIDRIAALEGLGRARAEQQTEEDLNQPPEFLSTLEDLLLGENALAHFETRLTPINDPSMKVEWFHNGKNLSAGSRIKTINDFGFVILEVANVLARDSGNYTCKAVNRHGEASVSCQVQVKGRQGIDTQPQLPKSFQTGTDSIHNLEERMWKREEVTSEEFSSKAPMFVTQPRDQTCFEGQAAHFDCRIEPIGDGSMSVEWYHDGAPIQIGSRIHTINDFGFVVLDIDWTFKRDTGVYKCVAKNRCGTAEVTANLTCRSKKDIIIDSQLPQGMSTERLKELEQRKAEAAAEADSEVTVPKFITQIQSRAVGEGEPAHFECRVDPKNDPKLQIKWYHNGKEVDFGHRFRLTFEFGYVALDILYTYPEDEGEYVCKAFNELGEDITRAELRCKEMPAIQLENQVPKGMKKSEYLVQMEATMRKYTTEMFLTEDDVYDSESRQPPRFVTQIQSITSLEEMQATKFECQLAPVGDPNMKVEWFYNGKPLPFKTRFTPIYDFGYVAMNFGWVYPEDSGEYICRATNLYGTDETRAIIKCSGKTGIVYESQLPKGMMSIDRIREMESGWQRAPDLLETETEKFKPCFVTKPEAVSTTEGGSARFCCRVTGYPKPRVMWLINGHTVINGSRHKLIYDGMWHLDIPKCQDRDGGKIEVIARNQCGEAYATTTLTVKRRKDDYRSVLRHNVKRDFINSDEYRKPEWLIKMEEIKERLAATVQAPKFVREIKEIRIKEGMRGKFEAGFAGNPKPEITWWFNGQQMQNSKNVQIKLREDSSTLTLIDCSFDMAGIYECRAVNDQGNDKCRASLSVNKLTTEEKAEYEKAKSEGLLDLVDDEEEKVKEKKKVKEEQKKEKQKKEEKKVVKKTETKVEEKKTYDWKKGVKKAEQKEIVEAPKPEKIALKKPKEIEKVKEAAKDGPKLKPIPAKAKVEEETKEGPKLKPIPQKPKPDETVKKAAPTEPTPQKVPKAKEEKETTETQTLRKVSFQQQTVTSTTATEQMASATTSMQETQAQEQRESTVQQELTAAFDVKEGDAFYALATFVSETGEAMNLVEGERVYVLEWNNADWWYVKKHLTEETGWVPAQYLKDEETYTMYVQRKLVEKIEKLPVFEKPKGNEKAFAPKITEKVKSQRSPDGAQVEFVCRVEGYPRPQITWFRQTAIIKPSPDFQIYYDENNMATLVIKEVFPEDAGTFTCVAKNCVGFASSSAELIVEHPLSDHAGGEKHDRRSLSRESSLADIVEGIPPTFAQRPSTKTADEGSNVELECRFVAIPEAEVRWFYNKKEIKSSGRISIENQADMHMYCSFVKITKVCKEDEGTYEVIAKNREGEATNTLSLVVNSKVKEAKKQEAKIEVKIEETKKVEAAKPTAEPPVIVKPLTPTVCKVGDKVNIETVITGKPQPKLKWYHNGKHFKSGKNVTIKENGSTYCLSISKAELKNDGDYTVKAENEAGGAQTSANICVQGEVVEFINKLDDKEVKEREVVMLEVEVTSENTDVKWHKDGEVIQDTTEKGYKLEKKGKKHSLIIEKATVHHEGEYVCSVGDQECSCEVSVVELPPEFTKALSTVKTTCGEKAVFEIEISKGDAKTKWFRKGQEIEFNENIQLIIEGKKQRLELYNVEVVDAGEITCTLGDKECKGALEVEEPKVNFVARLPPNTSGSVGQDVKITVNLTANCNVKWMKEGKEIAESEKYNFECDGTTRTIIIKQASLQDVAEYTCVAESVRTSTELELEGQEQKIEFNRKEMRTEETIKKGDDVTFTVPFADILAKKPSVQWMYKSTEIKTSEKIITTITKKYVSITIKHVESIDCGVYTCKMQNSVSQVSVDFTLTMKDKPSPPRGPAQVTWKTEDTLSLQWVTPESDGDAKIEEFIVERKEVGKKSWKQVGSSAQTNIEIVGLKKDASYNFRIIARNSVGCSEPFIIEETFTAAKAEIPKSLPGQPSVSVADVTSRSVTLNWNPPNDTGGVHLIGYIIEKRLSTNQAWERVETVESSVRIFTVENLKEKSEYFFRISAENEVGAGEAATTDKVSLQTHARVPSAPTAPLEMVPVGPHALTVEWGAPESDGGAALEGYKIAVRDAKRQMWMEVGRVAANVQKLTVKDLVEGCEYFIRIFAKNEVGFSDPLENEDPFKVIRPPDYTEEMEEQMKADDAPSLSFSTTETLSSWMREASMDADIQCYTKTSVLRRDEYFFRIWYYASKLFK